MDNLRRVRWVKKRISTPFCNKFNDLIFWPHIKQINTIINLPEAAEDPAAVVAVRTTKTDLQNYQTINNRKT